MNVFKLRGLKNHSLQRIELQHQLSYNLLNTAS